MTQPYRIIIYGAGFEYATVANTILSFVEKDQIEVLGIMAGSLPQSGTLDGFRILPKEALCDLEFDYLLLCLKGDPRDAVQSISQTYGIPREKIIRSYVLHQPGFDFERYIHLRESNLTIVADTCWGGFMYRRLDLRCASPFWNIHIWDADYLRLLEDLKGHCSEELGFSHYCPDYRGSHTHPVMKLGDVRIHFIHVDTPDEACTQWYERVGRINWDNLFIMMCTERRDYEHTFNKLCGNTKGICFVPYETSEPHSFHLITSAHADAFHAAVNEPVRVYYGSAGYPFDPVKLLLGEPDFSRYKPERGELTT